MTGRKLGQQTDFVKWITNLLEDIIEVGFKKPGFDRNMLYLKISNYHSLLKLNVCECISECCAEIGMRIIIHLPMNGWLMFNGTLTKI